MDTPSKEYVLDRNAARINHADNLAKAGALISTNLLLLLSISTQSIFLYFSIFYSNRDLKLRRSNNIFCY